MVDLIGNETALGNLLAVLEAGGFRRYTRLHRMARSQASEAAKPVAEDAPVNCAEPSDGEAIFELLSRSFDPHAEQLPTRYEIESAIESRQILVARRDGLLGGLLFFETQGLTSTIRYWLVDEPFRAFRLGSALMRRFLSTQTAVRRFVLWVIADNQGAIEKYRHYGFAPDGLVDHVLANSQVRA